MRIIANICGGAAAFAILAAAILTLEDASLVIKMAYWYWVGSAAVAGAVLGAAWSLKPEAYVVPPDKSTDENGVWT